ncbi:MAG: cupin domain-containing protein [Leptolyngbya sp. SIO1D8]|nr:cupin domain-containing protein [Leptolyngbya sp. SIO1D8]
MQELTEVKELSETTSSLSLTSAAAPKGVAATELRPWGSFTVLEEANGYKIKRIEVKPGHRLSLQMHHHRSEHWIVVSGTAKVTCGDKETLLTTNQSTYVPPCTSHRLENSGVIPLILIEVQNGEYLGEDDIVRFQDDYSRTSKS